MTPLATAYLPLPTDKPNNLKSSKSMSLVRHMLANDPDDPIVLPRYLKKNNPLPSATLLDETNSLPSAPPLEKNNPATLRRHSPHPSPGRRYNFPVAPENNPLPSAPPLDEYNFPIAPENNPLPSAPPIPENQEIIFPSAPPIPENQKN